MSRRIELTARPDWWCRAACAGVGPAVFFDPEPEAEQAAKAICARCDVSGPCRAWAVEQRMSHGVFGGLSPIERRQLTLTAARR